MAGKKQPSGDDRVLNARVRSDVYEAATEAARVQHRSLTGFTQHLLEEHLRVSPYATSETERWVLISLRAVREKLGDAAWRSAVINATRESANVGLPMPREVKDELEAIKKGKKLADTGTD